MKGSLAAVLSVATGLVGVSWVGAQDPKGEAIPAAGRRADEPKADSKVQAKPQPRPVAPFPAGYLDNPGLGAALNRLADAHPDVLRVSSLAKTKGGQDVWLATIARGSGAGPRPSVLIVANLEADHVVGSHVALGLVERLAGAVATDPGVARLVDSRTIYVVPRLNPDGVDRLLAGKPRADLRANLAAIDRDRDGKPNEDGPDDIDGDGLATIMRVKDAKATLVPDAKDARLLRKADPAKGERAVYSEMTEGIDNDGDGLINEDPPGGVDLNRNWPHNWTEYNPETGVAPASEPEVNALIRFAFAHPEIAAIWSFGLNDNLRAEAKGVAAADAPYFAELTKGFARATGPAGSDAPKDQPKDEPVKAADPPKDEPKADAPPPDRARVAQPKGQRGAMKGQAKGQGGGPGGPAAPPGAAPASVAASGIEGTTDGALSEWAYHQFGAVGLASRLWPAPEPAAGGPPLAGDGEARWLDWNDKAAGGAAFVPFHAVDHPTLGKVEVGGWKPGVRLNPPAESIAAIADGHYAFLKDLAGRLPTLAIKEAKAEARGGGVFEIKATVENAGYLPTALAQGLTTRRAAPVLVKLDLGDAKLLAGKALDRVESLPGSGGSREFRWLVLAPATKPLAIEASCPRAGTARREIPLR